MSLRRRWLVFVLILSVGCLSLTALAVKFDLVPPSLQAPRVLRIEPSDNTVEILPTSPITITFSAPMDQVQTAGALELDPPVQGKVTWRDAQTLIFSPRSRLPISTTLTLTLSPAARSWLRRPLSGQVVSHFTTLTRPFIVNSAPPRDAQFAYLPPRLTLTFSRAMDAKALADNLTLEPMPQNFSFALADSTLTLNGFFEPRTRYQITIPASVFDAQYKIALGSDFVWSFTSATQYPNFSILNRGRVLQFPANQPFVIPTQFTNVSRFDIALYSISRQTFDENANAPFETWYQFQPSSVPLKTWSVVTNAQLDQYTRQTILLDALGPGTYFLRVTAPEGVSDAQLILVE